MLQQDLQADRLESLTTCCVQQPWPIRDPCSTLSSEQSLKAAQLSALPLILNYLWMRVIFFQQA